MEGLYERYKTKFSITQNADSSEDVRVAVEFAADGFAEDGTRRREK